MMTKKPRVTSFDVARASGVSRATVSYVLNNKAGHPIPTETRQRVLKAVHELDYRPFGPARTLRERENHLILGVLPFEQVDSAIARDLHYLQAELAKRQLSVVWHVGPNVSIENAHPSAFLSPSAVISFTDKVDSSLSDFLNQFGVPVLFLKTRRRQSIGRQQVSYLVEHGKQNIAFAALERRGIGNHLNDVRQECARLGLKPPIVQIVPFSRQGARKAISKILKRAGAPLGVCCHNDEVAFMVLAALCDCGLSVPETVAVIGCDDVALAQLTIPPLTTVAINNKEYIDFLVGNIIAAINGECPREIAPFSFSLIMRQSA
jgi:DNA-binding LacI/PurR family transcriptional regulator